MTSLANQIRTELSRAERRLDELHADIKDMIAGVRSDSPDTMRLNVQAAIQEMRDTLTARFNKMEVTLREEIADLAADG
jgi:hypothetical protein